MVVLSIYRLCQNKTKENSIINDFYLVSVGKLIHKSNAVQNTKRSYTTTSIQQYHNATASFKYINIYSTVILYIYIAVQWLKLNFLQLLHFNPVSMGLYIPFVATSLA